MPRKVFIDLGANDGQSVDFFISGEMSAAHPLNVHPAKLTSPLI
jgi:hypothetical protein